jgi:hypothetical protein
MRNHVVHIGFDGRKSFMTNDSFEKFLHQPFELIYRNATYNDAMIETYWTEVYLVNWTYIEETKWPFSSLNFIYTEVNKR